MPTNNQKKWEEKLNKFIIDWCGDFAHLLDTDENDGERLRETIRQEIANPRLKWLKKLTELSGIAEPNANLRMNDPNIERQAGVIWK